jgi:hypothetical protein
LAQCHKRQLDASERGGKLVWLWITGRRFRGSGEQDDHADNCRGQSRHLENSLTASLDLTKDRRMPPSNQAAASRFDFDPIIADEPREKARTSGSGD